MVQTEVTTLDILIPCHNRANDIEKLINHLYKMECPINIRFTIHVIDDLSTDNSVEKIKNLQKKYSSLFLIQNKENKGLFFNRILLTNNATADYIFFMDDDDEVDDNLFIEFAKYTNYDLIRTIRKSFMGGKIFIDFEGIYKSLKVPSDMINLMTAYFITGIFISKYVYTKMFSILKQVDCNFLKLNIYEDQPYFYLMTNFTRNFIFINCYYHYIINPSGLIQSSSYDRTTKDALRILEILNKIIITLKKNNCYNVSPEFMLMHL